MYCKTCGNKLDSNLKFCFNCGMKIDEINNLKNKGSIDKNMQTINVICKIFLIIIFIFVVAELFDGGKLMILPVILLIATTIGVLKTEQKRNYIFLILSIIAIGLAIVLPLAIMVVSVGFIMFLKILGGFESVNVLDGIMATPLIMFNMDGGIYSLVILTIIGISFMIIHKKQKFKIKK